MDGWRVSSSYFSSQPLTTSTAQKRSTRHSTPAAVPSVTGTAGRWEPHLLLIFLFGLPRGIRTRVFGAAAGYTAAAARRRKPPLRPLTYIKPPSRSGHMCTNEQARAGPSAPFHRTCEPVLPFSCPPPPPPQEPHASALVAYVKDPLSVPSILHTSFQPFAADVGIILSPASLPFFQLGPNVVKQTMPFLGWCARAFSLVKKDVHFEHPAQLPGDAPAWHSTFFLNAQCHTYFSPRLIRQGVLTIGQLLEQPTYFSMLAPTWEPVYRHRLQMDQPLLPASLLPTFALPPQPPPDLTFWYAWTRAPVAELFSQPYSLKPRQPDSVWEAFHRCNLPPRHKDFIHKALWSRLPVGQRQ